MTHSRNHDVIDFLPCFLWWFHSLGVMVADEFQKWEIWLPNICPRLLPKKRANKMWWVIDESSFCRFFSAVFVVSIWVLLLMYTFGCGVGKRLLFCLFALDRIKNWFIKIFWLHSPFLKLDQHPSLLAPYHDFSKSPSYRQRIRQKNYGRKFPKGSRHKTPKRIRLFGKISRIRRLLYAR